MKKLVLIIFVLFSIVSLGQIHLDSVGIDTLPNAVRVVKIWDSTEDNVYISFFVKYQPIISSYYLGRDRIFAYLTGGDILEDNVYMRSVVCDSDAVDSSLRFIYNTVFRSEFSSKKIKQAILFIKQPDSLFERITRLTAYSRNSPLNKSVSEFMTPEQINNFSSEFNPSDIVIVLRGNLPHEVDTFVKSSFGQLLSDKLAQMQSDQIPYFARHNNGLYFVNRRDSALYLGFSLPMKYSWDKDLIKVLFLKYYFKHFYSTGTFVFRPSVFGSYIGFFYPTDSLSLGLSNLILHFEALQKNNFSAVFSQIKSKMLAEYDSLLSNPWLVNSMIYREFYQGIDFDYLLKLRKKILGLSIRELDIKGLIGNPTFIIIGNELLLGCELLRLSEEYTINFTDEKIYRYKIIKKGFDAWTVINRYVNFVRPVKVPRNLHYSFSGVFFTDSTFLHLKGDIWKTNQGLYRYETYVLLNDSAVLHSLILFDGKQWIDSTYFGSLIWDSTQVKTYIRQRYILSEIYYKRLGFSPEIICEPDLMAQNIFKIKVKTPGSVYFYDFYDMATREKLKTIINDEQGWVKSLYYKEYTRVRQGKNDFKIPFVIIDQTPYYTFTYQIERVSFRHIPRKVFSKNYNRVK